jgi:hypothetical protein
MRVLPCLAFALVLAAGPGAARDRNAVPEAVPTGKPVDCIPLRQIRESRVRNDRVIDFSISGDRYYRVTLPQGCPGLGFEKRFTYQTSIAQLCAQDIITVLQVAPAFRGASCGLAPFQPVTITGG